MTSGAWVGTHTKDIGILTNELAWSYYYDHKDEYDREIEDFNGWYDDTVANEPEHPSASSSGAWLLLGQLPIAKNLPAPTIRGTTTPEHTHGHRRNSPRSDRRLPGWLHPQP